DHGEWRVVLSGALATPDTGNEVQLEAGRAIPVAFFVWDGSSGEHGSRMALSTWYFLALDRPTPPGVFISPAVAMLVTLGLGLVVVRRAQRRRAGRWGAQGAGLSSRRQDAEARVDGGGGSRGVGGGPRGLDDPPFRRAGRSDDQREDQVHRDQARQSEDRYE